MPKSVSSKSSSEVHSWSIKDILKEGLPARYVMTLVAFIGFTFLFMLRVNINIAIVAMVNYTAIPHLNSTDSYNECGGNITENSPSEDGPFAWDEQIQSLVVGSFFWGYIVTQIPGGRLAEIFGTKVMFACAQAIAGLITVLLPLLATLDYPFFIAGRVLLGIAQGVSFPSMHVLLSKWAPPGEKGGISTFIYAGSQMGTIIGLPLSGLIVETLGWEAVFYIEGAMVLVFVALWLYFVYDTPAKHPRISAAEREYIEKAIGQVRSNENEKLPFPWKAILLSPPFWALLIANWGNNWGFYMLLTELPIYMKNILHFDMKSNSLLSALPYLVMWVFSIIVGQVMDALQRKKILSVTAIRKIANTISHAGPAVCLLAVSFVRCDSVLTMVLLTLAVGLQGALYSGFIINHLDLSPNFAGTIFGITGALATIPSWLAPLVVATLTEGQQTAGQWAIAFQITCGILLFDTLVFLAFGSGEEQKWNRPLTRKSEPGVEIVYAAGDVYLGTSQSKNAVTGHDNPVFDVEHNSSSSSTTHE